MKRGEIHWASVPAEHVKGQEQHNHEGDGPRPYLIVSDDRIQGRTLVVVACPLSTSAKDEPRLESFRLPITPDMVDTTPTDRGTLKPALLLCEQVRVMSRERFPQPSRLGKLKSGSMAEVDLKLSAALGLRAGF